jgi:replicative DNA helicase
MMLPHPSEVARLARERRIPDDVTAELQRLAARRQAVTLLGSERSAWEQQMSRSDIVREETLWALYHDASTAISWPFARLQSTIGAMMPGELIVIGARTGVGKTTVLLNLVDPLTCQEIPTRVLPFETPPHKLLRLLAAIRLGYNPIAVIRGMWEDLPASAMEGIETEVRRLTAVPRSEFLQWAPQGSMSPVQVYHEMEQAADCGCRIVVIDHLHRIALEGRNGESEMRKLMQGLKDRAEKLELICLIGAQLNRGERDPLRRYLPPVDTDLRGGGSIEEEADVVLGLYMPLKRDVTNGQMAEVRKGLAKVRPLVRANTTGIRIIKHRVDSGPVGEDVFLAYDHGRLSDAPYDVREVYGGTT